MSRLHALCLTLLLLSLLPSAAPAQEGYPPADSEVVFKARLFDSSPEALSFLRRLRGLQAVRLALDEAQKYTGLALEADLLSWIDGEMLLAVVRTGEESPFSTLFRNFAGSSEYSSVQLNLQTLYNAVELYQLDKQQLPPNLEGLVPDYAAALPSDPPGVVYELKTVEDGWEIRASFPPELSHLGPAPWIDSGNNLHPESPSGGPPSLNLVVGLRVADRSRAERALGKLLPRLNGVPGVTVETGPDRWSVATPVVNLEARLTSRWFLLTDTPTLLDSTAAALEGKGPSMLSNPRWQSVADRLPPDPDSLLFVDVEGMLAHWRGLGIPDQTLREALISVKALAGVSYVQPDQVVTEFFLRIDPPAGHPLAALLQVPGHDEFPLLR
ncbi:MAG: hypothetical protein AB1758_37535, partial [Candidatus Eremiobacterota bacterium]